MLLNSDWYSFPIFLRFLCKYFNIYIKKTNSVKINYIFKNLYNILSKDEKRARVDETEIVKK